MREEKNFYRLDDNGRAKFLTESVVQKVRKEQGLPEEKTFTLILQGEDNSPLLEFPRELKPWDYKFLEKNWQSIVGLAPPEFLRDIPKKFSKEAIEPTASVDFYPDGVPFPATSCLAFVFSHDSASLLLPNYPPVMKIEVWEDFIGGYLIPKPCFFAASQGTKAKIGLSFTIDAKIMVENALHCRQIPRRWLS